MNNKTLVWVLVALVAVVGVWYWFASVQPAGTPPPAGTPSPTPSPAPNPGVSQTPPPGMATPPAVSSTPPVNIDPKNVVKLTAKGFEPATLTVKKGTLVFFQNASEAEMWPASARHPTHSVYPTTGGCLGSTFDACRAIKPGGGFSFGFDQVGTWRYHDHLNSQLTGTIEVTN